MNVNENYKKDFIDGLTRFGDISKHFEFLKDILMSPPEKSMDIVDEKQAPAINVFHFAGLSLSLYVIVQLVVSLRYMNTANFTGSLTNLVVGVLFTILFLVLTYKIFVQASNSGRSFDDFLKMSALISGSSWTLSAAASLISLLTFGIGGIAGLLASIIILFYAYKLYKLFWQMEGISIVLYIVLVAIILGVARGLISWII